MKLTIRSIICDVCKLPRRTHHRFDVCPKCACTLKKIRCSACPRLFRAVAPGSSLCGLCTTIRCGEKIVCETCGIIDFALKTDPKQCRRCHKKSVNRKYASALLEKITCVVCGLTKDSCLKNEMICRACHVKRRYGDQKCSIVSCERSARHKKFLLCERHNVLRRQEAHGLKCTVTDCNKLAQFKKALLCGHHYNEQRAKASLEKYVLEYHSPFPQNQAYFGDLASRIDWSQIVTTDHLSRFRAGGDFLKINELPEVLSWRVIDDLLPQYGEGNSHKTKFVRSCLFDLGHLYAERGLIQDWNSYLLERRLRSLKSTPAAFCDDVSNFQKWVMGGMLYPNAKASVEAGEILANTAEVLLSNIGSLNAFLKWCVRHDVNSLDEVDANVIANYQRTLLWKFQCGKCGDSVPFDSGGPTKKCANEKCEASNPYIKVKNFARNSRVTIISRLRVFFDWAFLHQVVTQNPVGRMEMTSGPRAFTIIDERGKSTEVASSIRRYDDSHIQKICAYIVSPEADPEEAIIYYLVIFHLLTRSELCNLKIPSLVNNQPTIRDSKRVEDFQYLLLPPSKLSRGRRSARRPGKIIKFPPKALPWLVPLLERFYEKRGSYVKAPHNEYFLVANRKGRHNKPVSETCVFQIVQRSSQRLLGGSVNVTNLRQTAAAIFTQRSKRRSAVLTRMGYGARWATRFNYLEAFPLKPKPELSTHDGGSMRRKSARSQRDPSLRPPLSA